MEPETEVAVKDAGFGADLAASRGSTSASIEPDVVERESRSYRGKAPLMELLVVLMMVSRE